MKHFRRAVVVSLIAFSYACGGGGGGGGGSPPPAPPPPPPVANITGPASALPAAGRSAPITPINFTATGTAPFSWTVTGGSVPPGLTLSSSGVYSGTPTLVGSYAFTVTLTDANGTDTAGFTQAVLESVPESEPNDTSATADLLPAGQAGAGTLGSNDVDFWTFSAAFNDVIEVEIFGARRDFASWDGNATVPRLSIIGTNGTSFLVGHDRLSPTLQGTTVGWLGGMHDMDVSRFRIPAAGSYFLRIEPDVPSTPGGDYVVRVNNVSPGAIQAEVESNDSPGSATAITPGTIRGFHADEDLDFYSFSVSGPTIVTFEVSTYRNGISGVGGSPDDDYYDPQILIVAPDQLTVISGNDDVFFSDCKLKFLITTAGTYYLLVYETDFGTAGDADYLLTFESEDVGNLTETEANEDSANANPIAYGDIVSGFADLGAADVDFYSFSGTAGDMVRVYWNDLGTHETAPDFIDIFLMFDDVNFVPQVVSYWNVQGENALRAVLPVTGTYYIAVTPYSAAAASTDYTFQLVLIQTATFEVESNNSPGTANSVPGSGRVAGVISSASDVDVFSFTVVAGEVAVFSVHAGPPSANGSGGVPLNSFYVGVADQLAPDLEILDSSGTVLATTSYFGSSCSGESLAIVEATAGIAFVAPSAGTFYVRVSSADGLGGTEAIYQLERK